MTLAIELGHAGGIRLGFSLSGALLIIFGQKRVFGDRKRGDDWMETQEVNPNSCFRKQGSSTSELMPSTGPLIFLNPF
jgi:hypothetical protein